METTFFDSATDFLAIVRPSLEQDEAANNLMLGLALRLVANPGRYQGGRYRWPPLLAAVTEAGSLAAAALMTPPFKIIVYCPQPQPETALSGLVNLLHQKGIEIPGALGPSQAALTFARLWAQQSGHPWRAGMSERVYELRQVIPPPQPPGAMRLATAEDVELAARWMFEFWEEAVPQEKSTLEVARQEARYKILERDFYLWHDGEAVALAGRNRPTPHGWCIGPVYTPLAFRQRGYATALTAALSQRLLDGGSQFTALFTNLANPISNSIYQKIGYRPVCDFNEYLFG